MEKGKLNLISDIFIQKIRKNHNGTYGENLKIL